MSAEEAAAAKAYWARNHTQSARLVPGQDYRLDVARHIAAFNPPRVLEFGAASGRNLATLRPLLPDADLVAIDMCEASVSAGMTAHGAFIRYFLGDERRLDEFWDGYADVVFTVSVLDHVPEPEWRSIYDKLARVASKAVVLLEPVRAADDNDLRKARLVEADFKDLGIAAPPFTYAHDYFGHDAALRFVRQLPVDGIEQWQDFGRCYVLMERDKTA